MRRRTTWFAKINIFGELDVALGMILGAFTGWPLFLRAHELE